MIEYEDLDPFFTFLHYCPICGRYVDEGAEDGRCFDRLENQEHN